MIRVQLTGLFIALLVLPIDIAHAGQPLPSWSEYHGASARRTGWLAWSRADLHAAKEAATRAVRLQPTSLSSLLLLTGVLVEKEEWLDADKAAHELEKMDKLNLEAFLLIGRIRLERGRSESARLHYQQAASLSPQDARGQLGLALLAARHDQDWTRMKTHLREAQEAEPDLHPASLPLLPGWKDLVDNEEFIAALEDFLKP